MGWVKKIDYVPPHQCNQPLIVTWKDGDWKREIAAGSLWECDVCGTLWESTNEVWKDKGKSLSRQIEEAVSTAGPTLTTKRKRWYNR